MARTTKCTMDMIEEAERYLRSGVSQQAVAALLQIDEKTYYNWLRWGREEAERVLAGGEPDERRALHLRFFQTCTRARSVAELNAVLTIQKAQRPVPVDERGNPTEQRGDWRAAAWFLESGFPSRWGKRTRVEHSGAIATVEQAVPAMGDDELITIMRKRGLIDDDDL